METIDEAIRKLSEREAARVQATWVKIISTVAGALLLLGTLHQTYVMPTIREETRLIVKENTMDVVRSRELTDLRSRLDRIEGKLDRVIEGSK